MRNFGGVVLLLGILGFFYAGTQGDKAEPLPKELSLGESLARPAGRWEVVRWGSATAAAFGLLMTMFPKGR